jgi:3,4-dihydroxy-2-butanone 4-phosphate synthase
MPQEFAAQEMTSTNTTFTTGYASGTICPRTGSYKAQNAYMNAIVTVVKNAKFPNFIDGKKTTWYALNTTSGGTTSDGGFESTRVSAGTL